MVRSESCPILLVSNQAWSKYWVSKHWIAFEKAKHQPVIYVAPFSPSRNPLKWGRITSEKVSDNIMQLRPSAPKGIYRFPLWFRKVFIRWVFNKIKKEFFFGFLGKDIEILSFDTSWTIAIGKKRAKNHLYYPVDPPMGWGRNQEDIKAHKSCDKSFAISNYRRLELNKVGLEPTFLPHAIICPDSDEKKRSNKINEEKEYVNSLLSSGYTPFCYVGSLNKNCFDVSAVNKLLEANELIHLTVYCPMDSTELSTFESGLVIEHDRVKYRGPLPFEDVVSVCSLYYSGFIPYDMSIHNNWGMRSPFKASNYIAAGTPFVSAKMPSFMDFDGVGVFYEDIEEISICVDILKEWHFLKYYEEKRKLLLEQRSVKETLYKIFSNT